MFAKSLIISQTAVTLAFALHFLVIRMISLEVAVLKVSIPAKQREFSDRLSCMAKWNGWMSMTSCWRDDL